MKKHLLLLSTLLLTTLFCGCSIFGTDDNGGEDGDNPNLIISHEVIAGTEITVNGYVPDEYADNGYEILFGDTSVITVKPKGQFPLTFKVPDNLKGQYTVSIKSGKYKYDVAGVSVFKYIGDCLPGMAYKADLSGAHSIYCTSREINEGFNRTEYETKKFSDSNPVDVKFYNAKGREVPACFTSIKDISEDFFFAIMYNIRGNEELIFNPEQFTCFPNAGTNEHPVIVDKKTGVIIRLNESEESMYMSKEASFQWMGGRQFCFLPESYGGEFSSHKLYYFDIPEYMEDAGEMDEDFCYSTIVRKLPGQDNLDIINGIGNHWVAASRNNVLFNNDRMLRGGSLSYIEKPSENNLYFNKQVFCNYAEDGLYYISMVKNYGVPTVTKITPLSGSLYKIVEGCECFFVVYQYADHTYLRGIAEKAGDKVHDITMSADDIKVTEITVGELEKKNNIFEEATIRYPFFSNYEYCIDSDRSMFRRKIKERNQEETIYRSQDGLLSITSASSSRNALTFSVHSAAGNSFSSSIISTDPSGNVTATIELPSGTSPFGVCRLKD